MKVLGITDASGEKYICEMTFAEYCKLLNNSQYGDNRPNKLKVGDVVDLGCGYDFRNDIKHACHDFTVAYNSFNRAQNTLLKFAELITNNNLGEL